MNPIRVTLRWVLTLLAVLLVIAALGMTGMRLAMTQLDAVRDRVETALARQFSANLDLHRFTGAMQRLDPRLSLDDLHVTVPSGKSTLPLLTVGHADLRLDTLASLRARQPVIGQAHVDELTLHLYQNAQGDWAWPGRAKDPSSLMQGGFELSRLDAWVGLLLQQRVVVDDVRLVLHGLDDSLTLVAPQLLVAGGAKRAHIEGQWYVEGQPERVLSAVLEVLPGSQGLGDFSAALQAKMDLSSLDRVGQLLTRNRAVRLDRVEGKAELWARWRHAKIADARLKVAVPQLTLGGDGGTVELHDIGARAQWLRNDDDDGWQAWVNALSVSDATGPSPLPSHLQLAGQGSDWWLRSGPFSLDALAAWGERLPLPEKADRALQQANPRGQVSGLQLGQRDGAWQARVALLGAAVDPWQDAPGGGPVDAWVVAEDQRGHVDFVGGDGVTLHFPDIYGDPLVLDAANGRVDWSLTERQPLVTGKDLHAQWRGAPVDGSFELRIPGDNADRRPGRFVLDLAMRDVDARDTPLAQWLPMKAFDDADLREWLSRDITGRVPRGTLHLEQKLDKEAMNDDGGGDDDGSDDLGKRTRLKLSLDIEQGRLPYETGWPPLENVSGHLDMVDDTLEARVDHAEARGLVTEGATASMADDRLTIEGPVQGSTQSLLQFLSAAPIDGTDAFSDWRSEGHVEGRLKLGVTLDTPENVETPVDVDVTASVEAPSLRLPQSDLALYDVNGDLRYRHDPQAAESDTLTGQLGARVFDGPLLADFEVGGKGVTFEGRALARGLLEWGGAGQLSGLLSGYFPYSATLDLDGESPQLSLDSDLQGLGIQLPAPFGKVPAARVPFHLDAATGARSVQARLADRLRLRWRSLGPDTGQGQVWLEQWPDPLPAWPGTSGWQIDWRTPRLALGAWQSALAGAGLAGSSGKTSSGNSSSGSEMAEVRRVTLNTPCLAFDDRCLGDLAANATRLPASGWQLGLAGSLVEGQATYRPRSPRPIDVQLQALHLDNLLPEAPEPELGSEIVTATEPRPIPLPDGLNRLPDGHVRVDTITRHGQRLGPFEASWEATPERLRVAPLSMTLGEITGQGEVVWEASGAGSSLTRSRLTIEGGDLGSALERLDQPVAVRSTRTRVQSQLAWPGAPWQFALERSRGSIQTTLDDGRFVTLDSPSARLIGLLNVDNLLRRLRLDFSDVTEQGTAFDSVKGDATLYGGRLETRGPVEIDGASTQFSLDGSVDLMARKLDLKLGVTVPVSQNLPLAAVLAGAPYVGGALFLADKLFGGWLDKVTRIYYRVQGPWTSPRITLEDAE